MQKISRAILVLSLLAISFGLAMVTFHMLKGQFLWRVAIGTQRGDDPAMIEAIARWLAENNRRSRIEVRIVASDAAALDAVRDGMADAALARTDAIIPGMMASVASLYPEVAMVVGLPRSGITDWPQLRGKTVALVGHTKPDDALLKKILQTRNVTDVRLVSVERRDFDAGLARNAFQGIANVGPLVSQDTTDIRAGGSFRRIKKGATVLEVVDAESLAATDKRYVAFDIPGGGMRDQPPLPEEEISTLAVMRHLMVRGATKAFTVQRLLIDIMDAKRAISSAQPLARKIGSPGTDKDGAVKIHPGAIRYFNGEEIAISDIVLEWIYVIPMVAGAFGAIGSWLASRLWRRGRSSLEDAVVQLVKLRQSASQVRSAAELRQLEPDLEQLSLRIGQALASGAASDKSATSALLALDLTERALERTRQRVSASG